MKKFLIITASLLVIALILVVAVFWYVSAQLKQGQAAYTAPAALTETGEPEVGTEAAPAATGGIHLKDVPLSDAQQNTLETVGVDVDTFVITPAIQACAAEKLGQERMAEIAAGAAPTALETVKLVPCLGAE